MLSPGSSRDSKTSYLNCFYEAIAQKEALTVRHDGVFASFLCVLSLSSVLGRFLHLYWTIQEKNTGGLRIWNFQGYWRNSKWIFGGLTKSEVEFPFWSKEKGNLVTIMEGSLTACIGVVTIKWPAQETFSF